MNEDKNMTKIIIEISKEDKDKFKLICVQNKKMMSVVLRDLIKDIVAQAKI